MRQANMVASVPVETNRTCSAQGTALHDRLREADRRLGEPERRWSLARPAPGPPGPPPGARAPAAGGRTRGRSRGSVRPRTSTRRAPSPWSTTNESSGGRVFWPRHAPGQDRAGGGEQLAGPAFHRFEFDRHRAPSLRRAVSGCMLDTSGRGAGRQRRTPAVPTAWAGAHGFGKRLRTGSRGTSRISGARLAGDAGMAVASLNRQQDRAGALRVPWGRRAGGTPRRARMADDRAAPIERGEAMLARIGAVASRPGAASRRPRPTTSSTEEPAWLMT